MSYKLYGVANSSLKKEFEGAYDSMGDDYVDQIAFYINECTDEHYQWKFETPDKQTHVWKYFYDSKEITKECH